MYGVSGRGRGQRGAARGAPRGPDAPRPQSPRCAHGPAARPPSGLQGTDVRYIASVAHLPTRETRLGHELNGCAAS